MAANPQALIGGKGITGTVRSMGVTIHTVPQALEVLRVCLVQVVQAATIVLRLHGAGEAAADMAGLLPPKGPKAPAAPTTGRQFSAAAKARMSAGMKVYWKKRREETARRKAHALKASMAAKKAKEARAAEQKKAARKQGSASVNAKVRAPKGRVFTPPPGPVAPLVEPK